MHRQTRDTIPMMYKCWLSVVDSGPTLIQQCSDVPCLTGMPHVKSRNIPLHVRWTTRRDMICGRLFSTNHSEPSNDWQLKQQWQHVYDQTFNPPCRDFSCSRSHSTPECDEAFSTYLSTLSTRLATVGPSPKFQTLPKIVKVVHVEQI